MFLYHNCSPAPATDVTPAPAPSQTWLPSATIATAANFATTKNCRTELSYFRQQQEEVKRCTFKSGVFLSRWWELIPWLFKYFFQFPPKNVILKCCENSCGLLQTSSLSISAVGHLVAVRPQGGSAILVTVTATALWNIVTLTLDKVCSRK